MLFRSDERLPLPRIELPLLFTAEIGPAELTALADALVEGIEALA